MSTGLKIIWIHQNLRSISELLNLDLLCFCPRQDKLVLFYCLEALFVEVVLLDIIFWNFYWKEDSLFLAQQICVREQRGTMLDVSLKVSSNFIMSWYNTSYTTISNSTLLFLLSPLGFLSCWNFLLSADNVGLLYWSCWRIPFNHLLISWLMYCSWLFSPGLSWSWTSEIWPS